RFARYFFVALDEYRRYAQELAGAQFEQSKFSFQLASVKPLRIGLWPSQLVSEHREEIVRLVQSHGIEGGVGGSFLVLGLARWATLDQHLGYEPGKWLRTVDSFS